MFRPELLAKAKGLGLAPLSADAGTGFSAGQADAVTHQAASVAAGELLFRQVLDALVQELAVSGRVGDVVRCGQVMGHSGGKGVYIQSARGG